MANHQSTPVSAADAGVITIVPGRLYIQNHGGWPDRPGIGVLRRDDHGHTWRSISKGLPSDFGFPIVVHPDDPNTVYVIPLEPATRTCPGGEARTVAVRG